jgi:hypothetical protein
MDLRPTAEEPDHDAVFRMFGEVAYQTQSLERLLAIVLALVLGPGPTKITRSECRKLVESYFTRTFGTVRKLEQAVHLPEALREGLAEAVKKRNWLAHHYFWDRKAEFETPEGRQSMLAELREIGIAFEGLTQQLRDVYVGWLKAYGVDPSIALRADSDSVA